MMKQTEFELEIVGGLENISVIIDFVASTMRQLGVDEGIAEFQTAVDEACTNIIKHAYSGQGGKIAISCKLQKDDIVITIRDYGEPFNPSSVPLPDLEANLEERRIGGLGIYMMRKLMDDVSYNFDAHNGNSLVMRKKLGKIKPES